VIVFKQFLKTSNKSEMTANFLLDLDQTLISSEKIQDFDTKKYKNKVGKFRKQDMDGYYYVFERPGLQEFLTYLFDNFNVSVCTAASKDYALFIIDKIILAKNTNRKLDYILFSYHCRLSNKIKKTSKNLTMLWDIYKLKGYNKDNTVILDDYRDEVYDPQKKNCIVAKEFNFTDDGSENDDFLPKLTDKLRGLVEAVKAGKSVQPMVEEINKEMKVEKTDK